MKINIKAKNIELTAKIKDYAERRAEDLKKFIHPEEMQSVIFEIEVGKITRGQQTGDIFRAELNLEIKGEFFRTVSEKDDILAAIDEMKEEMARVLRKNRNKKRDLFRRGSLKIKNLIRGFYK